MLEKLRMVDESILGWQQSHFQGRWLDHFSLLGGNVYFWAPVLVFLAFLLYMQNPKRGLTHLLFAVASLILSYQASFLLSYFIALPGPYVIQHLNGGPRMPGFSETYLLSFPDWSIAAMMGGVQFIQGRLVGHRALARMVWIPVLLLTCFLRMHAGLAYPSDLLAGIGMGTLFGWIFNRFLIHFEYVSESQRTG
jgi:hypothetical protein